MKQSEIDCAVASIRARLAQAAVVLGNDQPIEVADFGLGRWNEEGLGLVVRVNEPEYCSKYLTLEPNQVCPMHFHLNKKETFFSLTGEVWINVAGREFVLRPGESTTILPGQSHTFGSHLGAVVEEVSSHDENEDSYFANPHIIRAPVIVSN